MHSNCIKDLLNLKEVIIKSIKNLKDVVEIHIELPIVEHTCPSCGSKTTKVHDYYTQPITDIPIYFKPTEIIYKKRRYECKHCGHSFFENNNIVNKYANTHLPKVLCIDEFKGNTGHFKYQVALINGETHEVIDILECRYKHFFM